MPKAGDYPCTGNTLPARISALALISLLLASCVAHDAPPGDPRLRRLASVPEGAEVTGLALTPSGDLFFNAQHPYKDGSPAPVGVLVGVNMHTLARDFKPLALAQTAQDKQRVRTAVGVYQVLLQGGERDAQGAPKEGLGGVSDPTGQLITAPDRPDFNAFVTRDAAYHNGFLFTSWETRPGAVSRLEIHREGELWRVDSAMNVDFSAVQGLWGPCFGSLSPWGTPLVSEELYVDNSAHWYPPRPPWLGGVQRLAQMLGYYPNPYRYGYIVEIVEPKSLQPIPVKQFALGRFSHENAVVMPDYRTVYLSDDGDGGVLFKFEADLAGDLSSGVLSAARFVQDKARPASSSETGFSIQWIRLAHGTASTIASWIAQYDGANKAGADRPGYITDAQIQVWARGEAADDRAAFLESRKAALARGASAELNKAEGLGIHLSAAAKGEVRSLFLAVSRVDAKMSDDKGAIRLPKNICGVVYRLPLDSAYQISRMEPVVAGKPLGALRGCDANAIAGPDNLLVMPDGRLLIGEDSEYHDTNMLWVFDPRPH